MTYDEFLGKVQHRAALSSHGEAERITWAMLQTLGERLSGGEAKDFAAQLPHPLPYFALSGLAGWGSPLSLHDFLQLVANREGVDLQQAEQHVQAVWSVLQEALTAGEVHDICAQLPTEYKRLFQIGSGIA